MVNPVLSLASAVFLVGATLSPAAASPAPTAMRDDGYTLAPFSFAKFCLDYPRECPASGGAARVALTPARMAQLDEVNRVVNGAIIPTPETSKLRYWHLNVAAGDCNSFAIQKRHDLLQRGWPAGALALTVARTASGEGHLVVTVRTDQGDLVLDNLRSRILSWRQTGYHFIMRQSAANPQFWVELHGGQVGEAFAARGLDGRQEIAEAAAPIGAGEAPKAAPASGESKRLDLASRATRAEPAVDDRLAENEAAPAAVAIPAPEPGAATDAPAPRRIGRGGGFVADFAFWMRLGLAAADLAPAEIHGWASALVQRVDRVRTAEAARAETPVAALATPIEPDAAGCM